MTTEKGQLTMEALASLCKRRGFIFQSSEIYGGINGFWDYGPLGCELKRNITRRLVARRWSSAREDVVGLDASIIMHPRVWEASGHVGGFADPMVDCKACKKRFRADQLCEEQGLKLIKTGSGFALPEGVKCPACGSKDLTEPRAFNLMFKTYVGPVEDESARGLPPPGNRPGHLRPVQQRAGTSRARRSRSASPRSARRSATRSTRATTPSARASSSRWSWSSSSSPAPTRSGTSTGSTSA